MSNRKSYAVSTKLPRKRKRHDVSSSQFSKDSESGTSKLTDTDSNIAASDEQSCSCITLPDIIDLWPGGKVYYCFENDYGLEERLPILASMAQVEVATQEKVVFKHLKEAPADDGGYLIIKLGDHYEATLGYIEDEPAEMILTTDSLEDKMGVIMHEILHSLGIRHEHNRPDRDRYVQICWDNIEEEEAHNFFKSDSHFYKTFGVPYNYYSVMHYGEYTFGIDEYRPTMLFKEDDIANEFIGQRCFLTMQDIELLNKKYTYEVPRESSCCS
ncbi:hypothetical protein O3M35_011490 [Rhynocoris fuscipes]|uniref:Metalloendopeptidase n=1 Tax=Rhynocoris fuscipes TaxID=488301 RepID=A0AAW1CYP8_9HEMI